ncbi:ScbR family autoregulator-binding transcription factor [Streptomyces rubradiris]|uniref:Gamma-butyrolactone-binding protein n=1 Tax=Streptomyces rubradiris TaxID=285531 RepID=A0ABQ3RQY0_STRRR|nr:ScbR family autoregulator-binding transcription factor [Streptomyces rubradiris]GHH24752.1 gamma-butyrolactone-binding protein [Streptomyces rubradiris]GHI58248.1 gamma-butyrolactone-binding protein [Streptomyces rubradiris]
MAQQERAVRTREAILLAAAQVFDEVGYEAAKVSEILTRSGVTKGALYFHFESKEQLARGVLHENARAVPPVPPQQLKLQEAVDRGMVLAYRMGHDPLLRGSVRLALERPVHDTLDRRVPFEAWTRESQALLEEARLAGELQPHVDTAELANLVVGAFAGIQLMSQAMCDRQDLCERAAVLYRVLMASVAMPGVLVQLDVAADRGARVHAIMDDYVRTP